MSQRTPKICQPYGKVVIPIEDGECLFWLIPVDSVEDIENPTRDFAWITPDGIFYVFDGKKIVPINDPNTLKVQFQNVLGDPYDNGNLATALNEKVNGIRMNDRTVPMGTNGIVDLGCITTCEDLEQAIAGIDTMKAIIVEQLPETGEKGIIYLTPKETEPEYVMPCHVYAFTESGAEYVSTWTTPSNALPITDGHSYTVTVDDIDYQATGTISQGVYTLTNSNVIIQSYENGNDTWTLTITLSDLPQSAEKVDDNWNITVCVATLPDTVYEMNLWIDGEYRTAGAKPISIDLSEIERQIAETQQQIIDRTNDLVIYRQYSKPNITANAGGLADVSFDNVADIPGYKKLCITGAWAEPTGTTSPANYTFITCYNYWGLNPPTGNYRNYATTQAKFTATLGVLYIKN